MPTGVKNSVAKTVETAAAANPARRPNIREIAKALARNNANGTAKSPLFERKLEEKHADNDSQGASDLHERAANRTSNG